MDVGSESAYLNGESVGDGEAVGDACGGGVFRVGLAFSVSIEPSRLVLVLVWAV